MTVSYALRLAAAALLSICALQAQAAITCTVSSSGFTSVYSTTITTANDSQGAYTINCTRGNLAVDPTSFAYTLQANNGQNACPGSTNCATNGTGAANRVTYEVYIAPTFATAWGNTTATAFSGTVNFGNAATATASDTKTFYARIPAQQNVNAKTFSDTVALTLCNAAGTDCSTPPYGANGSFSVSIITTAECQFTTPPGTVTFNYTSFQVAAATANTPYSVRCTNGLSYTPSLDAAGGTLLSLDYTLALSNPATATANGLPQSYTINGTINGGLSGTCSTGACTSAPQQRTLTITY